LVIDQVRRQSQNQQGSDDSQTAISPTLKLHRQVDPLRSPAWPFIESIDSVTQRTEAWSMHPYTQTSLAP
jgi:hypothetical protein